MAPTLLVPLDGSPLSEQALPYAQSLGQAAPAHVILLRAEHNAGDHSAVRAYLDSQAERLKAAGVDVQTAVSDGEPASAILAQIATRHVDVVVMGTHGRSGLGRWLYGSVADQVVRQASVPVMLVPHAAHRPWPPDRPLRVLVALDGSDLAVRVLAPVRELASWRPVELLLVELVDLLPYNMTGDGSYMPANLDEDLAEARAYVAGVASEVTPPITHVETRVEVGYPSWTIADMAREADRDLIALATHGRSGVSRAVLGSVATGTLQHALVPVLLVGPEALAPSAVGPDQPTEAANDT